MTMKLESLMFIIIKLIVVISKPMLENKCKHPIHLRLMDIENVFFFNKNLCCKMFKQLS